MKLNFLVPKQPIFFNSFVGLSEKVVEIAELLNKLFQSQNIEQISEFSKAAKQIEHQADEITHNIVFRLNRTFVTPFDREDIYNLTEGLDDIIDLIENVIHNIEIYKIDVNEKFLSDYASIISQAAGKLSTLTKLLQKRKYSDEFKQLIVDIHTIEDRGDEIYLGVIKDLFENGRDPISVIKIKDINDDLENVIDEFQATSNTFENILVKSQ